MTTGSNWILAVLDDLVDYANKNDLRSLANEIRAAKNTARTEIAGKDETLRILNKPPSE